MTIGLILTLIGLALIIVTIVMRVQTTTDFWEDPRNYIIKTNLVTGKHHPYIRGANEIIGLTLEGCDTIEEAEEVIRKSIERHEQNRLNKPIPYKCKGKKPYA